MGFGVQFGTQWAGLPFIQSASAERSDQIVRGYRPTTMYRMHISVPDIRSAAQQQVWPYLDVEMNGGFYSLDMGL